MATSQGAADGAVAGTKMSKKDRMRQSKARKSAAARNNSDDEDTTTEGAVLYPNLSSSPTLACKQFSDGT